MHGLPSLALESGRDFDISLANMPPAPGHLILMGAVRGWAHVDNRTPADDYTGRPARHVWVPPFIRSIARPDWCNVWLRLAEIGFQNDKAPPETLAAVRRLQETGFERQFLLALADTLER